MMVRCCCFFYLFIIQFLHTNSIVLPPPLNVQATQSSASAPVEVSWSPPSSGATNIIGYRIFYGNGENTIVPSVILGDVSLVLNEDYIGQKISVRSEADQLFSEFVTITVSVGKIVVI